MKIIRWSVFIGILLALLHSIVPTHHAHASNAVVSTCDFASLSSAVTTANSGGGTITFTCSDAIVFSSQLTITANVTINGGGNIIFNGNAATGLFGVSNGASLTLDGLTLQNGRSNVGGAILINNGGTLTISDSIFSNNSANLSGGAIDNSGTLTISNSTFNLNTSDARPGFPRTSGGAIYSSGTLTISDSIFSNNSSNSTGGAIYSSGTLTISNSTFSQNTAQSDFGTVSGGAIYNRGILTISNSTFSQNTAQSLGTMSGGAISTLGVSSNAFITHSTFSNNNTGSSGAIYADGSTIIMTDSVISGTGTQCNAIANGILNVNSTNLTDTACGDATVVPDLKLGAFNGQVVLLKADSPARDAYPAPCAVSTDHRGVPRPSGGACDIGATEMADTTVSICDFANLSFAFATANTDGGTITFTCSGTIIFSSQLTITANVTINGGGNIIFNGNNTTRLFVVGNGASLTLEGLTLQNGRGSTGGAIFSGGTLTISNSTFNNNSAFNEGGVIANNYGGILTISNSTFSNNSANSGGAIYDLGTLTISDSIFSNNSVTDSGGAIFASGTLTISNSTFSDNSANLFGGAVRASGTTTISNSTFNNNSAFLGGAIRATDTTTITHSTFTNHTEDTLNSPNNTLTVTHSIISGTGTLCTNAGSGMLNINSTNLSNLACGSATIFANLGLGTFDGRVVPLLGGSPAIEAYFAPCVISTDQLGNPRPFGIRCDVGAVEFINPIFNEQQFLASMQSQATTRNSPIYPLVLDIVPNGLDIALNDNMGQIGTASISLTVSGGILTITITQTTGTFADQINAELPQLVMWSLDNLFAQAGIVDTRIRVMTINPASINFEMGAP
jgi:predicted outer membrane repeat protein